MHSTARPPTKGIVNTTLTLRPLYTIITDIDNQCSSVACKLAGDRVTCAPAQASHTNHTHGAEFKWERQARHLRKLENFEIKAG